MAQPQYISKVAIIGVSTGRPDCNILTNSQQAGGHLGAHFTRELLKTGKHTITAVTRAGSTSAIPTGVKIAQVDYSDDGSSLIAAIQEQEFLVITLSVTAPPDLHSKIVKAAVKAGVKYIMPNVYGYDIFHEGLRKDVPSASHIYENAIEAEKLGSSYIALVCGQWYEWSLALGDSCFGFDFKQKKVTFYDDGNTRVNISTWDQCGRALSRLLSLPETEIAKRKNAPVYISSFFITQKDILENIHRVAGSTDADWTIVYEPSVERFEAGNREMKEGSRMGFAKAMYARTFFPSGGGNFELTKRLANEVLGLPKEDLDQATRRALEMVERGWNPFNV